MNAKKTFLLTLVILFLAETALGADQWTNNGDFYTATCTCTCTTAGGSAEVTASAVHKAMDAEPWIQAIKLCHEKCARICGGYTTCSSDDPSICTSCCSTFCSSNYADATQKMPDKCQLSCSSTCGYKGLVNDIVNVIYYAAGTIGALMLIINGLRLITSQDPNDRSAAKNGIIYVIIALIIIILAATLVGIFMNSAATPQT
jgi:hypothetical protein